MLPISATAKPMKQASSVLFLTCIYLFKSSTEFIWFLREPKLPPELLKNGAATSLLSSSEEAQLQFCKVSHQPSHLSGFRFYFFSHQRENPSTCFICKSLYILCLNYTVVPVLNTSMRVFFICPCNRWEGVCVSCDKSNTAGTLQAVYVQVSDR